MRKFGLVIIGSIFALLIGTSNVIAYPDLGTVLEGATLAPDPYGLLDGVNQCGEDYVYLTDLTDPETIVAIHLFEDTGYTGSFGIYDYHSSDEKLCLFGEGANPISSATVEFDLTAGTAWYDANSNRIQDDGETANIGTTFGFYFISPESMGPDTFYTDKSFNEDSYEHGLIYDTRTITGAIIGDPDVVVAFEDSYVDDPGNPPVMDYNDMVIGITDVAPIPEPASVLLLGAGLVGLFVFSCRRKVHLVSHL